MIVHYATGFEDLTCHCGQSRIPAPVPCGTSPPTCDNLCMRQHPCGHPPQHTCHSDEKCPPCPVLIAASCLGEHHIMNSVPCYIQRMSCGRPCGKGLPNCDHLCTQTCHSVRIWICIHSVFMIDLLLTFSITLRTCKKRCSACQGML